MGIFGTKEKTTSEDVTYIVDPQTREMKRVDTSVPLKQKQPLQRQDARDTRRDTNNAREVKDVPNRSRIRTPANPGMSPIKVRVDIRQPSPVGAIAGLAVRGLVWGTVQVIKAPFKVLIEIDKGIAREVERAEEERQNNIPSRPPHQLTRQEMQEAERHSGKSNDQAPKRVKKPAAKTKWQTETVTHSELPAGYGSLEQSANENRRESGFLGFLRGNQPETLVLPAGDRRQIGPGDRKKLTSGKRS